MNYAINPAYLSAIFASVLVLSSPTKILASESYDLELVSIAHNESRQGKNIGYKVLQTGMHKGMRAGGWFGMMPLTVKNVLSKSAKLRAKYGYLLTMRASEISRRLDTNRVMDKEIALYHWTRLRKKFSPSRAAYAWLYGSGKAEKISEQDALKNEYVQNFYNHWHKNLKGTHESAKGSKH